MGKRDTNIRLIGEAALCLKPHICAEDFELIMSECELAVKDNGDLSVLDMWNTPEMYSYEQLVRYIAEQNNLIELISPILIKLEQ